MKKNCMYPKKPDPSILSEKKRKAEERRYLLYMNFAE